MTRQRHRDGQAARTAAPPAFSTTRFRFVVVITGLSVLHHLDHVLRDLTGWPLDGGVNPFTASLLVYPAILGGVLLSRTGRAGARFWATLAGGGAVFVLAVHVGPAAGDSVTTIPAQYGSPIAGAGALSALAALLVALLTHCRHEVRRTGRGTTHRRA